MAAGDRPHHRPHVASRQRKGMTAPLTRFGWCRAGIAAAKRQRTRVKESSGSRRSPSPQAPRRKQAVQKHDGNFDTLRLVCRHSCSQTTEDAGEGEQRQQEVALTVGPTSQAGSAKT